MKPSCANSMRSRAPRSISRCTAAPRPLDRSIWLRPASSGVRFYVGMTAGRRPRKSGSRWPLDGWTATVAYIANRSSRTRSALVDAAAATRSRRQHAAGSRRRRTSRGRRLHAMTYRRRHCTTADGCSGQNKGEQSHRRSTVGSITCPSPHINAAAAPNDRSMPSNA